jgi:hypothetical protein
MFPSVPSSSGNRLNDMMPENPGYTYPSVPSSSGNRLNLPAIVGFSLMVLLSPHHRGIASTTTAEVPSPSAHIFPSVPSSSGNRLNVPTAQGKRTFRLLSPHHRGIASTPSDAVLVFIVRLLSPHHRGIASTMIADGMDTDLVPSVPSSSGNRLNALGPVMGIEVTIPSLLLSPHHRGIASTIWCK